MRSYRAGTLQDLQQAGKVGNFVVRDVFCGDHAPEQCAYVLTVHGEGGMLANHMVGRTDDEAAWCFVDKRTGAPTPVAFPTIAALVETHATTAVPPVDVKLETATGFLSVFSKLAKRSSFRSRKGSKTDRLDRAAASIRCIRRGEETDAGDAAALADLWGAVEVSSAGDGEEEEVFGFGELQLKSNIEQLDNAVKLRQKLRRHSAVLAEADYETAAADPFFFDKEEARLREESFKRRGKGTAAVAAAKAKEEQDRAARSKKAEMEVEVQRRKLNQAKRLSMQIADLSGTGKAVATAKLAAAIQEEIVIASRKESQRTAVRCSRFWTAVCNTLVGVGFTMLLGLTPSSVREPIPCVSGAPFLIVFTVNSV
jgi:hypothetical protein